MQARTQAEDYVERGSYLAEKRRDARLRPEEDLLDYLLRARGKLRRECNEITIRLQRNGKGF
jgi:hypothetical protein